jgi:hypothetical protein
MRAPLEKDVRSYDHFEVLIGKVDEPPGSQ